MGEEILSPYREKISEMMVRVRVRRTERIEREEAGGSKDNGVVMTVTVVIPVMMLPPMSLPISPMMIRPRGCRMWREVEEEKNTARQMDRSRS